jgi:hypothetical protein
MQPIKVSGDLAVQDFGLGDRTLMPGFSVPDAVVRPAQAFTAQAFTAQAFTTQSFTTQSASAAALPIADVAVDVPVTATIRQTGGNLERAKVLFYLSPDAVLNRSDRLLDAVTVALDPAAASSLGQSVNHAITLPTLADGFWQGFSLSADGSAIEGYIAVAIEGLYGAGESITENNRAWTKFSLTRPPLQRYDFTYHYAPPTRDVNPTNSDFYGDFYRGSVIAPQGHYAVGQWIDFRADAHQGNHNGLYEITAAQPYFGPHAAGQVEVVDYFDHESVGWYRPVAAIGSNYLGSESGNLSPRQLSHDRFGGDFYEADVYWTAPTAPTIAVAPRSSDPTVQALINSELRYWDTRANGGVITYSFYQAGLPYAGSERVSPVNEGVKRNVRQILTDLEQVIPVEFVEVEETAGQVGVLRYLRSDGEGRAFYAYTYYPNNGIGSDVHLSGVTGDIGFDAPIGSYGYRSLLHETLHALGLKHPGQYDAGAGAAEPPYLNGAQDHSTNTIMSYNLPGAQAVTAMPYDIAALQYLYGQPIKPGADTTYQFTQLTQYQVGAQSFGDRQLNSKMTIVDQGGNDTLDFSGLSIIRDHRFDLRPSGMITTQAAYETQTYRDFVSLQPFTTSAFGVRLSQTTQIENLVNSIGHDSVMANDAANQFSGYRLGRRSGNDVYAETSTSDRLVLQDYQLADLQVVASDAELLIRLAGDGTIRILRYFDRPMLIHINGLDYRYDRQTLTWVLAIDSPSLKN